MRRFMTLLCAALLSLSLGAQDLTILHINDTHSHIDPQRAGDYKGRGGVIEQAAFIDSVRTAVGKKNVLLLHAGDYGQGTSYFTELGGNIEIDVMNAFRFDATCLGNHEFDNGIAELARRLKNLRNDVVCANYDFTGTLLEGLVQPYTIVKKAGMMIGVIGLLTDIRRVVDSDIAKSFQYLDPVDTANRYAEYLKDEKNCDMVICLSHLGYGMDKVVAASTRNLDLIVGGHSHTLLHKKQVVKDLDGEDVIIIQNWKWGLNIGQLSVDF
jgi:5'-nucleotidase